MNLTAAPLTPDRWSDLEAIFNAKGCSVARGCWCMAYRLSGSRGPLPPGMTRAQANRAGLKALVDASVQFPLNIYATKGLIRSADASLHDAAAEPGNSNCQLRMSAVLNHIRRHDRRYSTTS